MNKSKRTPRLTIIGISLAKESDNKKIPFSIVIKPITLDKTLCFMVISHKLIIIIAVFILGILIREIDSEFHHDMEVSHLSDLKDYEYND